MDVDETVDQSQTNCFKYQSNEELYEEFDYHVSESGWSSSNPSSSESPNLNRNFYKRKGQGHLRDRYRTNYAQTPENNSGYYSSSSFAGLMNSPISSLEKSFIRTGQENTPRKENQMCIGLKPSERISYLREILPLQNESGGYTSRSKWELMASPKAPLRRPNSSSSHLFWTDAEPPSSSRLTQLESVPVNDKNVETKQDLGGIFKCEFCSLIEKYNYKGRKPPFARDILYEEDCYVMKDPFSLPNRGETLVIGSDCSMCNKTVCLGCSIFYSKRFCQKCATNNEIYLPHQLQIKKKLSTKLTNE